MTDRRLAPAVDVIAPDGSEVRILASADGGSMAHFKLHPGQVSRAVVHRSVEEIWFVLAGQGQMWRMAGTTEFSVALSPGLSLVIPRGTSFQFRCDGDVALEVVAVTMPPWPGDDEARCVEGKW